MKSLISKKIIGLKNKITPKGVILLYHRVAEVEYDPWSLVVSPKNFEAQLIILQKKNLGISLKKMAERLGQNKLGFNSLALTFDDGYGDNYSYAKPLLEKYAIPATFFIATAQVGQRKEFWWDELENILFASPLLPDRLQVRVLGTDYFWDLASEDPVSTMCQENLKIWHYDAASRNNRQKAFLDLWTIIKPLAPNQQEVIMAQLRKYSREQPREYNFPMTSKQLLEIEDKTLFCLGAHTCNHPSLPALSAENQGAEISDSIRTLEDLLSRKITTFSYPYGDYNQHSLETLKNAGVSYACTTEEKCVFKRQNPYELPRFQVKNWDAEDFEGHLRVWFNTLFQTI